METSEHNLEKLLDIISDAGYVFISDRSMQLLELKEKNQFLIGAYLMFPVSFVYETYLVYFIFSLDDSARKKVNIYSLKYIKSERIHFSNINFNPFSHFYFIMTKNGTLFLCFLTDDFFLIVGEYDKSKVIIIFFLFYLKTLFTNYINKR